MNILLLQLYTYFTLPAREKLASQFGCFFFLHKKRAFRLSPKAHLFCVGGVGGIRTHARGKPSNDLAKMPKLQFVVLILNLPLHIVFVHCKILLKTFWLHHKYMEQRGTKGSFSSLYKCHVSMITSKRQIIRLYLFIIRICFSCFDLVNIPNRTNEHEKCYYRKRCKNKTACVPRFNTTPQIK